MILRHYTYELLEIIRNAHIIDDEEIDHRLLDQFIKIQRSFWLSNSLDKNQHVNDSNSQEIIIDLEKIEASFSSFDLVVEPEDTIIRSKLPIPNVISSKFGEAFTHIGSVDMITPSFSHVSFSRLPWVGTGRFNGSGIFTAYHSNYMYAKYGKKALSDQTLTKLRLKALFEDPTEVPGFDVSTDDYPISGKIWALVKDAVVKTDLRELTTKPVDRINDADDKEVQ